VRIYARGGATGLQAGVLGLLLAAVDAEPSQIWLVSPWLRDVELPIGDQGHFASVMGGQRDEIRLSELLVRLRRRHDVHVVSKTIDELVSLNQVRRIAELLAHRDALQEDHDASSYEVTEHAIAGMGEEIAALADEVTVHAEMVSLLYGLADLGINVHVLDRLHAKLLWTPAGAMLGSANFTHGGVAWNEELMVEVSDPDELADLRAVAAGFAARGAPLETSSIRRGLERALIDPDHFQDLPQQFAAEPMLGEVAALLNLVVDHAADAR
jgi:hypothetical protein